MAGCSRAAPPRACAIIIAPRLPRFCERLKTLQDICARWQVSLTAAALQFACAHPAVTSVVAGAMSAKEVESNLRDLHLTLPAEFWAELRAAAGLQEAPPGPL